jgi:hypothetical protein
VKLLTQISSIIVALLFVYTINFKSFVTASYFINQAEIIELFCINKEKPQLKCDGKCHLATQLSEAESDTEDTPFAPNSVESNLEISFSLLEDNITLQSKSNNTLKQRHFNYTPSTADGYNSILSPPPRG